VSEKHEKTDPTPVSGPPRRPLEIVPQTRPERERLLHAVERHVRGRRLTPPLSLEELSAEADAVLAGAALDTKYQKYATVLVSNELWREALAAVPYDRRLLLLPQCLRSVDHCPAEIDEFGLVCQHCGRCPIGELQAEAERLGYAVLVAEGTTVVTSLVANRRIDAIVGVSCLSVLEKVFPFVEAGAVPGVAIPLLNDGCANTATDLDWLWEAIYLTRSDRARWLDLDALRDEVRAWFAPEAVESVLGAPGSQTERIAQDWLARSGKRWRPFLAVCAYQALQDDPGRDRPEDLRRIALAVECFHKASLIHDDIEDEDEFRYGQKALHAEYGVPVALNVGDFLIGEGYRLIGQCGCPPAGVQEMLCVAAEGHRRLSLGQGAELCWRREPWPLDVDAVIDIFRAKTAPAFDVSLQMAAVCAGADRQTRQAIGRYSEALGVAYQIRDDIADFRAGESDGDAGAGRPSVLLALSRQGSDGPERRAERLLERYKDQAVRALRPLSNATLKGLLRRVVAKIFSDIERIGAGGEYQAGHAPGRGAGAGSAA